jgi:hypothetical protein
MTTSQTRNELTAIDSASRALAQARTLGEIKEIRDKAEAVRKYAQSAALGLDAQNKAAEVKLRAERKAGRLLAKLPLRGGDRKSNNRMDCLKLEDLGISQNQSTRWQRQATLPEREFEEYLRSTRRSGREISTAGIMRLARQFAANGSAKSAAIDANHETSNDKIIVHNSKLLDGREPLSQVVDGLTEISHHRGLLSQLLEPIYAGQGVDLVPAQRRVLGHLLREMQFVIEELQLLLRKQQIQGAGPRGRLARVRQSRKNDEQHARN